MMHSAGGNCVYSRLIRLEIFVIDSLITLKIVNLAAKEPPNPRNRSCGSRILSYSDIYANFCFDFIAESGT